MQSIGEFLNKLHHVKSSGKDQWIADCPCLSHKTPGKHLSIGLRNNTILLTCFGNDTATDITAAMGLTLADLFIASPGSSPIGGRPPKIVATYDYKDEKGEPLFQVIRYEPKGFKQRHKDGNGEWTWNLDDVRRVLYHLEDVSLSNEVYIVEGEKDADNLLAWGKIATTSPGGANAWRPEYANFLKGKRVIIIPDKDAAGYAYAKDIVKSIESKAPEIKVIILPGEAKDISDWLEEGNVIEQLSELEQDFGILWKVEKPEYKQKEEAISWQKASGNRLAEFKAENVHQERTGVHARISLSVGNQLLSWDTMNIERRDERSSLASACHKMLKGEDSKIYTREDVQADMDNFCAGLWEFRLSQFIAENMSSEGVAPICYILKPYILEHGGTIIFSAPGRGKSYTALLWAVSIDAGISEFWDVKQEKVLFLNLERSRDSVRRRLGNINRILALDEKRPLLTLNARGKNLQEILPACHKAIKEHKVKVVILDSISRAGLGDLTENIPGNKIIDTLSALCPTWLALGHTARQSEEHLYGSIMQDAGADICIQIASQVKEGKLGIGYQITKQNDTGWTQQKIYALEFGDAGLQTFRKAKGMEFPDIESKRPEDMESQIIGFLSDSDTGDATATEIERELGFRRSSISQLFRRSDKFMRTRRVKNSVYYGVKEGV